MFIVVKMTCYFTFWHSRYSPYSPWYIL